MRCKKYRGLLEEWLDGELSGEESAGLERHLRACAGCAQYLEGRDRLGMTLKKNLHELTGGLHFRPRVANGLLEKKRQPGPMTWLPFNSRGLLAMAAATLIVLLFIFHPWEKLRQKPTAEKLPTTVITVSDSLNAVDESFISGRVDGSTYIIHMQVSAVAINDRT